MKVVGTTTEMRDLTRRLRREGKTIAFVPTMGFLHEGHASLLRIARRKGDVLVLSIFVNPAQFGPSEDLSRYPRNLEGDLAIARRENTDIVFTPTPAEMYGTGFQTWIDVTEVSKPLCGASRPGHFRGVATVVAKLLNIVHADVAVFGEKDFQQLAVIRQMVRDLDMDVEILGGPLVRETDGLAMSSRNVNLSPAHRRDALVLKRAIDRVRELSEAGETSVRTLIAAARKVLDEAPGGETDYVEIRDASTLKTIDRLDGPALLALAVRFGGTRLIDNTVLPVGGRVHEENPRAPIPELSGTATPH